MKTPPSPARALRCMYIISLSQGMVFYGPIATLYRQSNNISMTQIMVIEACCTCVTLFCEVPWGMIADRIGYRRTLLICNGLYLISKLVFWQANSFPDFLIERILLGIVCAGLSGVDQAYLALASDGQNRMKVFGRYEAIATLGLVSAAIVCSLAVGTRYRFAALLTVGSYAVAFIATLFLPDLDNTHDPIHEKKIRRVNISWKLLPFLAASGLLAGTNQTVTVFLSQLLYVRSGMTTPSISIAFLCMTLCGFFGFERSARLAGRSGEKHALLTLSLSAGLCSCALAWSALPAIATVAAICLIRFCLQAFVPIRMEILQRTTQKARQATMLSTYAILMYPSETLAELGLGKLSDQGLSSAMAAAGICCFVAFIFLLGFDLPQKKAD